MLLKNEGAYILLSREDRTTKAQGTGLRITPIKASEKGSSKLKVRASQKLYSILRSSVVNTVFFLGETEASN